jgi:hypothetical protein
MNLRTLLAFSFVAAGMVFGGGITTTQALACLDYNINHNNCSSAFSGTLNGNGNGDVLHFTDVATSTFGIMHVSTQNDFTVNNDQAWSYGFVSFQDVITINSATHQGQAGFVLLGYRLDGTVGSSGVSDAFNQVTMRVNPGTPQLQNWVDDFHSNVAPGTVETHLFQITYGTPFTLYFSMQATGGTAQDFQSLGYNFISKTGSGTSSVHFENTFTLSQLTTEDGSQNPVNDPTFVSDSGTLYSQQGVVPEPALFIPSGIAIAAFALVRFRRNR